MFLGRREMTQTLKGKFPTGRRALYAALKLITECVVVPKYLFSASPRLRGFSTLPQQLTQLVEGLPRTSLVGWRDFS